MSLVLPVEPNTYFAGHAVDNRVGFSAPQFSVRLTPALRDWAGYATDDLDNNTDSKMAVLSLAVQYGAMQAAARWDFPVGDLAQISTHLAEAQMEGDLANPGEMNMEFEQQTLKNPNSYRMEQHTVNAVRAYGKALKLPQSHVVRIMMALAFYWYDRDVFVGDKGERWHRHVEEYASRFEEEMRYRIQWARDRGADL